MFCITLALGLICANQRPTTPSAAAAVLAPRQYVGVPLQAAGRQRFVIIPSSPTAGPFGEFKPYPKFPPLNCCPVYITRLPRDGRK